MTAAWLRLVPAPEAAWPVAAFYDGIARRVPRDRARITGAASRSPRSSIWTAGRSRRRARRFRSACPTGAGFLVIAEADGSAAEAARLRDETVSVLGEGALAVVAPSTTEEVADALALARRRDLRRHGAARREAERGHRRAARPARGGDRGRRWRSAAATAFPPAAGATPATATSTPRSCSPPTIRTSSRAPRERADDLLAMALELGGTVSGEHGLGLVRSGWLARQWGERAAALHGGDQARLRSEGAPEPREEGRLSPVHARAIPRGTAR